MTSNYCVFGYYGQGNTGDEAILASIIDGLSTADIRLAVYSDQPQLTSRLHSVAAFRPFPKTPWRLLKALIKSNRSETIRSLWQFLRADVVVVGGGGLFFDTPETNKWLKEYYRLIDLAKRLGKKVAVVGVSVGPFHHQESEIGLGAAFSKCDFISVRDEQSRFILVACGVEEASVEVIPDLVFALPPCDRTRAIEILNIETGMGPDNLVVLAPCSYNMEVAGWLDSYRDLVNELTTTHTFWVVLVPMQLNGQRDDREAVEAIIDRIDDAARGRVGYISKVYAPGEIEGIFSLASFVFSERLHGTIMAANTGRPFLSLAYMPKVSGVAGMLGKLDSCVSMTEFCSQDYGKVLASKIRCLADEPSEAGLIHQIRDSARHNFLHLSRLKS